MREITDKIALAPYFQYIDKQSSKFVLYKADSLKIMQSIPDESIDLIFADPPYFLSNGGITCHAGKMVSVNKGYWDKTRNIDDIHEFNKSWLSECQRILTKNGTIWITGTSHIIHSIGFALQQLSFKLLNNIVWNKINPPPNLSCRYFTHSTETIIWAAKNSKSKHIFNYSDMKAMNGSKQMKNIWEDINPQKDIWHIYPPKKEEKLHGKHPTQKPIKLLDRIIKASSCPGNIILDPFNGHGTSGIAASMLNRNYIGIDIDEDYLNATIKRFQDKTLKLI